MISIKKYLDGTRAADQPAALSLTVEATPAKTAVVDSRHVLPAALACCRSGLRAMGKAAARASVLPENELSQQLAALEAMLVERPSVQALERVQAETSASLDAWAEKTAENLKQQAGGVKELLLMLAGTAESIGERDRRYAGRFQDLTAELQAIANLKDLVEMQNRVKQKATDLKQCVSQMTEEGQRSLTQLRDKVTVYETKLEAVEQLAMKDTLTGVANRRSAEARMERYTAQAQTHCIAILDLNRFKQVNDTHGHAAGDDLLKKFADELAKNSRATDLVARWGGDEFIVILPCDAGTAEPQIERIRKWVLGKYTIEIGGGKKTAAIEVGASIGLAQWMPGMTEKQVIEQADKAMYADKEKARKRTA